MGRGNRKDEERENRKDEAKHRKDGGEIGNRVELD